jgi:methylenetetrahydrofolate dehydrogenase (NADP+)/methenyltetrahydrofolate cyclohydrolase
MIIDGKKIAEEIKLDLKEKFSKLEIKPTVAIVQVGDDPVTSKFVRTKQKFAEDIGVNFDISHFPGDITVELVLKRISELNNDPAVNGIVVQLPLPKNFDTQTILDSVLVSKDIDVLSSTPNNLLTPVVGVVKEILSRYKLQITNYTSVVIVGQGKLVGKPVTEWFRKSGANVTVLDKDNWEADASATALATANIVVTGAGVPGLIKPTMIKDGVVLIDAGTSESSGKLVGDMDPACADKASVFTPVPGGVGPVTIAMLYKNLLLRILGTWV